MSNHVDDRSRPIGVFDSGVGGLTVLAALKTELPDEQFIYLGDTARLPYGTKSQATVERYALQVADVLVARGIKALIVACNTASATALPAIQSRFKRLPVIGVVEPGAQLAVELSAHGSIAVLGTEATVRGGAYQQAIARLRPGTTVRTAACQLLVALAEEGWTTGPVAQGAAQRYLEPLFGGAPAEKPDTLVLGCTHFPMLRDVIAAAAGADVRIVDSAATTASAVRRRLEEDGLLRARGSPASPGRILPTLLATDGAARFARVGSRFLGCSIAESDVELIDI
ncbi:MAG TPA: glutamate racemase [Steroidobacteraceae bacterium]|nr:glutamate racemase [Steroidobacteraceae bacterium]